MGRPPAYDKDRLLQAIIDCLWERGYAGTPVSVLVEKTGVNAASLYARFGSKKGMMLAALDVYARETIAGLSRILASTQPGPEQIRAVFAHAMESFADPLARGCFLVNTITNVSEDSPDFSAALSGHMETIRNMLKEALAGAPGLRPGVTPEDAALLVQTQIWGIKLLARLRARPCMGEALARQTLAALFTDGLAELPDWPSEPVQSLSGGKSDA